ncbi:MAG: Glycerophosphoryl diester phosphodiesterase [Pelagibacterales bacterium]|nr:Glycerophosphoryl diester phosphodiesterase [Pelagibacterales bacterium]
MHFGNKKYLIIVLILFSLFFLTKKKEFKYDENILNLLKNNEYKYIAHAGGGINNVTYTNSVEAVSQSIERGFKLIEIDLMETTDGIFVGVHDWLSFKKMSNSLSIDINAISYKEFKKKKLLNKYKPITVEEINKIFHINKDLILITDKSNNFKKILKDFKFDHSRIIVEIFGKKNYFKAIKLGITNPMFSAYHKDYDFIIKNDIKLVAASIKDIKNHKEIYRNLIKKNIIVFAYTANGGSFVNENFGKLFTSVYTDFWDFRSNTCVSKKCTTN